VAAELTVVVAAVVNNVGTVAATLATVVAAGMKAASV
jgi:hypothetical protein